MDFDVIVIGGGAMGTSAAYMAQKKGFKTLLLEQNNFFHTQGSSHGESRIIRLSYSEPYFIKMMKRSYLLWNELENEGGRQLVFKTGGLDFGKKTDEGLKAVKRAHQITGLENEILDGAEITKRFPHFKVDEDYEGIFQPDSGIVNPTLTLQVLYQLLRKNGGKIIDNNRVIGIQEFQNGYRIITSSGSFTTNYLVLTPGSWLNSILDHFNLEADISIWGMTYAFWKIQHQSLDFRRMPIYIHWADEIHYGFPEFEKAGYIKAATHISPVIPKIDPLKIYDTPFENQLKSTAFFVGSRLNGVETNAIEPTNCKYTMTKNENFIIGNLDGLENVVVASGFSGHGFKFTPLIGDILVDLLQIGTSDFDLSPFAPRKFISEKQ